MDKKSLDAWLKEDKREVYGERGIASIYPHTGEAPLIRINVTDEQNMTRLKILASLIDGSFEIITKPLQPDLLSRLRFARPLNQVVEGYKYGTIVQLRTGNREAVIRLHGEHLFEADIFIDGRPTGGNNDMDISELAGALTNKPLSSFFIPGVIPKAT